MKLKEIYDRDIFRDINPAVVVSDQKKDTIEAEIKEYVFTDELIEKLYIILDTILNKKSGKTGIWINGYYGSGKSHFIKYVHYLLDLSTTDLAFDQFEKAVRDYDSMKIGGIESITLSNIKLLRKKITASNSNNIMFNVEDETDDGEQERLTRIFLNMFNKFRGYNPNDIPLAILLEKQLDQKGVFQEFKRLIDDELGFDWDVDAATVASFQLDDVLEIAKRVYPSIDTVSLHAKLSNPESFKVGINATLIPELNSFLKDKNDNYRLLFLVDEISQYIGSNKEILLNFQNIIERVSNDCNNQVWIACTAQQTLDEVSIGADGVQDVQDEFGKILGRFDTRISLQSSDASYITQRRVLDKNSVGIAELNSIYSSNKDYIENQFKITHELYKGYSNQDEFILSYPFIPYQFKLIAHVFEAFQQLKFVIKQVKDNERSILGITHFTAKLHADDNVGDFIPFDAFYNQQFQTNLTNRGAKAVQNALELSYVKKDVFAQRVVKVLFMISNLLENQRQTFASNIDNMTVLLMDKLDQNKMQLQKKIKEVLDKLIEESIIREENGSYFFFNEDEMDVQNLIKSQTIGLDDKWSTFDNIFRPIVKISQKVPFGQNDFKMGYKIENKEIFRNGDFNFIVLLTDNTSIHQKALDVNKKDLVLCINEWFNNDETLRKDFDWYCRTNKYFTNNTGGETGARSKTNDNFRIRNKQIKEKIEAKIKLKFNNTRFISQNNVLESDAINGSVASDRVKNLIEYHLSGIYKNHNLSNGYAKNQSELKRSAADKQVLMPSLTPAEQFVNDFITANNNQITVLDLINKFAEEPFGWRFEAVLDVLVNLVKKKKREFVYRGKQRYPIVDFINKAVTTTERGACEVVTGEEIDQAILDEVIKTYKYIFNEGLTSSTDGDELFDYLQTQLLKKKTSYSALEKEFYGAYPFGKIFNTGVTVLNDWTDIRDPKKLFNHFIGDKEESKELFDTAKGIEDFTKRSLKDYNNIRRFVEENKENFSELSESDNLKVSKLIDFLKLEIPMREFRHARKAYDEVNKALDYFIEKLREEVIEAYKDTFKEIDKVAASTLHSANESDESSRDYLLRGIEKATSIALLKLKKSEAADYKTREIERILNYVDPTPTAIDSDGNNTTNVDTSTSIDTPKPTKRKTAKYHLAKDISIISNKEELDEFITKIRREMTQLINEDKTIILK